MRIPVPDALRGRAGLADDPAPARDAATIAVVREGDHGLEAFLMRRQSSMAFAAGMYVFPGGGVHTADSEALPWVGPTAGYFARRFSCAPDKAHALVVAAARETFEETGVLLAGPDAESVVADAREFHDARAELENHDYSFADFLQRHGLLLRADLLGEWAHWITPKFEPRRYDTRFFVTVLPEGQRIDSVSTEADRSLWAPLGSVLESVRAGSVAMLPPTSVTCQELSLETVSTVLTTAQQRAIRPIEPQLVEIDGELWLEAEEADHL